MAWLIECNQTWKHPDLLLVSSVCLGEEPCFSHYYVSRRFAMFSYRGNKKWCFKSCPHFLMICVIPTFQSSFPDCLWFASNNTTASVNQVNRKKRGICPCCVSAVSQGTWEELMLNISVLCVDPKHNIVVSTKMIASKTFVLVLLGNRLVVVISKWSDIISVGSWKNNSWQKWLMVQCLRNGRSAFKDDFYDIRSVVVFHYRWDEQDCGCLHSLSSFLEWIRSGNIRCHRHPAFSCGPQDITKSTCRYSKLDSLKCTVSLIK